MFLLLNYMPHMHHQYRLMRIISAARARVSSHVGHVHVSTRRTPQRGKSALLADNRTTRMHSFAHSQHDAHKRWAILVAAAQ